MTHNQQIFFVNYLFSFLILLFWRFFVHVWNSLVFNLSRRLLRIMLKSTEITFNVCALGVIKTKQTLNHSHNVNTIWTNENTSSNDLFSEFLVLLCYCCWYLFLYFVSGPLRLMHNDHQLKVKMFFLISFFRMRFIYYYSSSSFFFSFFYFILFDCILIPVKPNSNRIAPLLCLFRPKNSLCFAESPTHVLYRVYSRFLRFLRFSWVLLTIRYKNMWK